MKKRFIPMMTLALCAVLIVVYLLDVFAFAPAQVQIWSKSHLVDGDKMGLLTQNLKLVTSKVLQGEIWRPVTSMFLHAGLPHILFNSVCLLHVGALVERRAGAGRTLLLFLLSGIFSAVCMMLLTRIEDGLGASTAIFGLFGGLLVLIFRYRAETLKEIAPWNWMLLAVMLVAGNAIDEVTRLEHLTGTIGGVLFGILLLELEACPLQNPKNVVE